MANPGDFDPIAAWQQAVGSWERQFNDLAAKVSGTEQFAAPMNQMTKYTLAARRSLDEAMEKVVQSMQVASSTQIEGIAERLDRIEERLDTLIASLSNGARNEDAAPEPRRTRKPASEAP